MTGAGGPRGSTAPTFLRMRVIRNAVLVPRATHGDKTLGAGILHRRQGVTSPLEGTGVRRRGREYVLAPPTDVEPTRRIERAVYGGFLFDHYGHFLLESLGRLWFEDASRAAPVAWIAGTGDRLKPWMGEMLDHLAVTPDRVVVDSASGPVEVGELLVPDIAVEVLRFVHRAYVCRLAVTPSTPVSGQRVWLSRSGLGENAGVDDEDRVESALAAEGWRVVHLEQMPIGDQIACLAEASHIAGIEGSALHTLVFVSGFTGTVDLFTRHGNANFEILADVCGWDQVRHDLPGGSSESWNRPSGARDQRWTGVDVDAAVATIIRSAARRG